MAVSFRSQGGEASRDSSDGLLEPYEAYTDSPNTKNVNKPSVQVHSVPQGQVGRRSRWRQSLDWIPSFAPRRNNGDDEEDLPLLSEVPQRKKRSCRSRYWHYFLRTLTAFFIMLGIIQSISLACGIVLTFFPDEYDRAAPNWARTGDQLDANDINRWPTDISRDIIPFGCHSHNDYWRRVPLYSALQAGCIGIEADVWLFDNELYVGHTTTSLTSRRTLRSMYVDPLVRILERQNPISSFQRFISQPPHGVFDTDPSQTLILLIDFKTDGAATWPVVASHLAPLRDRGYLTHFNGQEVIQGPITVVGTGNTPFDLTVANSTYRDIFFDAPLAKLVDTDKSDDESSLTPTGSGQGLSGMPEIITANTFNLTNSYYASVDFMSAIGFPWPFHFSKHQIDLIRTHVRIAHRHGLKVRYWGIPSWPRSLRNHIWRILAQEGVDMLNVDDLVEATKGTWEIKILDWWK
ncbi:uncharacterized protein N7503_005672 [Penicillium pulvis]|uniref:uncharacterized protein n=1 Tax=Penicillium pulvis TaxID=1562058 RepID=UPI0025467D22|nr:uncharacterized protein N7503_005672 [Penicillium pulvis]KAJ5803222.1 hypothetical protein N7503_005672 [Penicillium pulvis]